MWEPMRRSVSCCVLRWKLSTVLPKNENKFPFINKRCWFCALFVLLCGESTVLGFGLAAFRVINLRISSKLRSVACRLYFLGLAVGGTGRNRCRNNVLINWHLPGMLYSSATNFLLLFSRIKLSCPLMWHRVITLRIVGRGNPLALYLLWDWRGFTSNFPDLRCVAGFLWANQGNEIQSLVRWWNECVKSVV